MEKNIDSRQEYTNEFVRSVVTGKPRCVVEIQVEASKTLLDECLDASLKRIAKSVTLPGFRRGKAPESLIREKYRNEILKESEKIVATRSYEESQKGLAVPNLDPKGAFSYRFEKFSDGEAKLLLTFETYPSIPSVDPTLFRLSPPVRPDTGEDKVLETVRQALFFYAKWETVSGRPVQEGDFVLLDGDVLDEEGKVVSSLFKNTRFEVTNRSTARWMKEAVVGAEVDVPVVAVSVPDEDVPEEEKLLFQPKSVKLTVRKIEKTELPELTPELLEKMGVASEEDLKKEIEKQLNAQADKHVEERTREQALQFLLEKHPFDIPRSFLNKEMEFRTKQLSGDPDFMQKWNSSSESEKQKIMQLILSRAEASIRLSLLCTKMLANAAVPLPNFDPEGEAGGYAEDILTKAVGYILSAAGDSVPATV